MVGGMEEAMGNQRKMTWEEFLAAAAARQIVQWGRRGIIERITLRGTTVWCQNVATLEVHPFRRWKSTTTLTCGLIDPDKAQELSAEMDARLKVARAALSVRQVVRVKALWFITKGVICGLPGGLTGFNPAYRLTRDAKAPEPWKVLKLGEEFDAKIKVMGADDFILVSRRSLFPRLEQKKPSSKKRPDLKKTAPTVEVRVSATKPKAPAAPPAPVAKVAPSPAKPKVRHIIRG